MKTDDMFGVGGGERSRGHMFGMGWKGGVLQAEYVI